MMKATLAYAVWPWGLEKDEQLATALKDVKEAGFNYFESVVSTVNLFRKRPEAFKRIVEDHQVFPVSFYFWQRGDADADVRLVEESLDFLAANKIRRISVQAPGKQGGGATPEELGKVVAVLERIGRATQPYGIVPSLHPHANTMVMYENEVHFVLRHTDPALIGFEPDTAHLTVGRCDAAAICRTYADRIRFVHLKDVKKTKPFGVDADGKQGFEVYSEFLELGEGDVDIPAVFAALDTAHYDGYLTVELDRSRTSNRDSAFLNMRALRTRFADRFAGGQIRA